MNINSNFKAITMIFISCFFLACASDDNSVTDENDDTNGNTENNRINLGVGESAKDLLSGDTYTKLTIEVGYMEGFALSSEARQEVIGFLGERLNKPQGIEIVQTEIPSQSKENYTTADLRTIENNHRALFPSTNELTVWVSIVNGNYENESVIGVAYQNLSNSLMGGSIAENTGGINQASKSSIEAAVLMHELGHILGLVNITTPMVNEHQANGNHCDNSDCLMNFAVETTDLFSLLVTSSIPELDQNCKLDIIGNGGK